MSKRGKLAPLRTVFYAGGAEGGRPARFELRPALSLLEPPMAATLELQKLRGFDQVRGVLGGRSRGARDGRTQGEGGGCC